MAADSDSDSSVPADISTWKTVNPTDRPSAWAPVNVPHTEVEDTIEVNSTPVQINSDDHEEVEDVIQMEPARSVGLDNVTIVIANPEDFDRDLYEDLTDLTDVVSYIQSHSGKSYTVVFADGRIDQINSHNLRELEGGQEVLQAFTRDEARSDQDADFDDQHKMTSTRASSKRQRETDYVDTVNALRELDGDDDEDELFSGQGSLSNTLQRLRRGGRRAANEGNFTDDSDNAFTTRRSRRTKSTAVDNSRSRGLRSSHRTSAAPENDDDNDGLSDPASSESDDMVELLQSDIPSHDRKRKRSSGFRLKNSYRGADGTLYDHAPRPQGARQSGRSTRHQGLMEEVSINDIYRSDSDPRPVAAPKAIGAKETFKELPRTDPFRTRHVQQCDTCGNGANYAPLVYCQGCVLSYHKACLGHRTNREHLVTKVGLGDFVLQCRRCVSFPKRKEAIAPDQAKCQDCKNSGDSCRPFRNRKTPMQEQKEREDNNGEDPVYRVPPEKLNNPSNVLFRCTACFRGFHFDHLPPRSDIMELDNDSVAAQRFTEYARDWKCQECATAPAKVLGLVAWKPIDEDNYDPTKSIDEIDEDEKAYLVRWENKSYFRATWMPGPWVWGVTAGAMRKAFARREEARVPKMRTEDAIPEEFLRTDIVLDVKYTSIVDIQGEEIDKARIREVSEALIKFKGLGYEDAVWEKPPIPEDGDRWTDFVTAYNDWVLGKYIHTPKAVPLKARLEKARNLDFATKLERKKQPDSLVGGELMKYQLEGLNWLYYKWYSQQNAILADEMGLGKTIQIISFLATLVQDWNCFPFLVVVPNSTCPNWRREIKQWAPSIRVAAYYGSKEARDLAYRYELYPRGSKDLRCHIVVTSYDAAQDDSCKKFFRGVPWQALIVDEGQRLKNDKNILYGALTALKCPLRILLTGTPLQNNARELFNLLQFLDDGFNAAELEVEYETLTSENVPKLHHLIRPFFLRRTKAQVLTFLPPMAQIIVPVSMPLVQKKLYRSILAKNPDLLRAIFAEKRALKQGERASLSNILMQLRKCLCHPFVYNQGIEERDVSQAVSHRNLVEASGKLQLLEMLLPKLKERGHRVLIFSQFLDMLSMVEDFLDGLGLHYQRLDGSMGSLQKQKRIDEFNAPDSELFAFLLSTRAGGVGINLATADTVIILDPDFNPHQDIQALSRAHRIGQKNKVLCFHLVTRASAEEKMMQIGRKKMALDHVLIEKMDADDATDQDLESVLKHGASEIFSDDGSKDVKYDEAQIDKLLDRSHIEDTRSGEDRTAEATFSFARVWAHNELEDTLPTAEAEEAAPDPGVWEKILRERERAAAAEAAAAQKDFGRGRRTKINIDYAPTKEAQEAMEVVDDGTPVKTPKKFAHDSESDTDFQDTSGEEDNADAEPDEAEVASEVQGRQKNKAKGKNKNHLIVKIKVQTKEAVEKILKTKSKDAASASKMKKPAQKSVKEMTQVKKARTKFAAPVKKTAKVPSASSVKKASSKSGVLKAVKGKGKAPQQMFKSTFQVPVPPVVAPCAHGTAAVMTSHGKSDDNTVAGAVVDTPLIEYVNAGSDSTPTVAQQSEVLDELFADKIV